MIQLGVFLRLDSVPRERIELIILTKFASRVERAWIAKRARNTSWLYIILRSKRFLARIVKKTGTRAKKMNDGGGGWGMKEPLARKPHDFEKLRSPTNAAADWRGAVRVDYLSLETSIKPGMLCFRVSQIWSHLDWYLLESCLCEGLWDQSLQTIIGDRAVETREGQFIENDVVQIWLEKMDCLLEITST